MQSRKRTQQIYGHTYPNSLMYLWKRSTCSINTISNKKHLKHNMKNIDTFHIILDGNESSSSHDQMDRQTIRQTHNSSSILRSTQSEFRKFMFGIIGFLSDSTKVRTTINKVFFYYLFLFFFFNILKNCLKQPQFTIINYILLCIK